MEQAKFDLAIIGGGAAGIIAALSARKCHPDWQIVLIDQKPSLGRKILVTGSGRCNLTNINLEVHGENHFNHPEFVKKVFNQFSYSKIIEFFVVLGLKIYEEKKGGTGKIFPVPDQAAAVVDLLTDAVHTSGVNLFLNTAVAKLRKDNNGFKIFLSDKAEIFVQKVVLAAGGKTYPALGSDGTGFSLAEGLGHKIIKPIPSGVPFEGKCSLAHELQGVKINATVSIADDSPKTVEGDLLFTKYGLSGMAILQISRPISLLLNRENKKNAELKINFFPGYSVSEALEFWQKRQKTYPERLIEIDWSGVFPPKFARGFLKFAGLLGKKWKNVSLAELKKVSELLTNFSWQITATRGWNEAEFTAGGVSIEEINSETLESKIVPNLYFAGEIIDVDGEIGGYNLSWAWSSGWVAGQSK